MAKLAPVFEGYLEKRAKGGLKSWQKRYFILYPGKLTYHKDKKHGAVGETIQIFAASTVSRVHDHENELAFCPNIEQRTYSLRALVEPGKPQPKDVINRWIAVLKEQIQLLKGVEEKEFEAGASAVVDSGVVTPQSPAGFIHVWQFQRYVVFNGWVKPMLPTDPVEWAFDQNGLSERRRNDTDCCWPPSNCLCNRPNEQLSEWTIDRSGSDVWCDSQGWQFSWSFPSVDAWNKSNRPADTIRRRRWLRVPRSSGVAVSAVPQYAQLLMQSTNSISKSANDLERQVSEQHASPTFPSAGRGQVVLSAPDTSDISRGSGWCLCLRKKRRYEDDDGQILDGRADSSEFQ